MCRRKNVLHTWHMQITKLSNKYTNQTLTVNYYWRTKCISSSGDKYKKPKHYFTGKSQQFSRFIDYFAANFVIDIKLYWNLILNKDPKYTKYKRWPTIWCMDFELELVFVHVWFRITSFSILWKSPFAECDYVCIVANYRQASRMK